MCLIIDIIKSYNLSEMFGIGGIGRSIGKAVKEGQDKAGDALESLSQGAIDTV